MHDVCMHVSCICTTLKGNIRTKLPYRDRGDNNGGKITAYMMGFCVCIYIEVAGSHGCTIILKLKCKKKKKKKENVKIKDFL